MIFRLYHETAGGHVHCKLFAGRGEGALGQCGTFVMRVEEFDLFGPMLSRVGVEMRPIKKGEGQ